MTVTPFAAPGEDSIGAQEARALTDQIKIAVEGTWQLIERAYVTRAWAVLGYRSWDDYCQREFGTTRLRLPREERQEVVASLRESGLSVRAIEAATGISRKTVIKDIQSAQVVETPPPHAVVAPEWGEADADEIEQPVTPSANGQHRLAALVDETARVTGVDGKSYAATRQPSTAEPAKPKRRPLGIAVGEATRELLRATERLTRITEDDRFPRNRDEVHHQMPELISALDHAVQFIQAAKPEQATANEEARRWWTTSLNTLSDALADVAKSIEKES